MKYRRKINGQWGPWENMKIKSLDSLPIGAGIEFYGPKNKIPTGFLICDGSAISRTTYSDLFELIGTTYGTGDGSTTFNLPDDQGKVTVGIDENDTTFDTLGKTGGSKELQEHSHTTMYSDQTINVQAGSSATCPKNYPTKETGKTGTGDSGNLQPFISIWKLIKATNTTPTMASIVGTYNTSTQDGYNCDYVNNLHTYSTDEIRVGTWIDGKPIYRKVISASNIGTAFNTTISNIDNLFFADNSRISWNFNVGCYPIARANFYFNKSQNTIVAEQADVANWGAELVLEYTKTTD